MAPQGIKALLGTASNGPGQQRPDALALRRNPVLEQSDGRPKYTADLAPAEQAHGERRTGGSIPPTGDGRLLPGQMTGGCDE
jgi:hypothetical protein